jgi:hypothetical protein
LSSRLSKFVEFETTLKEIYDFSVRMNKIVSSNLDERGIDITDFQDYTLERKCRLF